MTNDRTRNVTAADGSRGENSHIIHSNIYTTINFIGWLDCHYLQTANGAIVGKQRSILNSQRFLLLANSLTLNPGVCFWSLIASGEWATEQRANYLMALVYVNQRERFNKHLHCTTNEKAQARWQIGHMQPKHKENAKTNLRTNFFFSSNCINLMLKKWRWCCPIMNASRLFSSLDAIPGSLFLPGKKFHSTKISRRSRSKKKKPSSYFIVTANRNSAAQSFTTKCGCCSVQLLWK